MCALCANIEKLSHLLFQHWNADEEEDGERKKFNCIIILFVLYHFCHNGILEILDITYIYTYLRRRVVLDGYLISLSPVQIGRAHV